MRRNGSNSGKLLLRPFVPEKTATWESCKRITRRGTTGLPFRNTQDIPIVSA